MTSQERKEFAEEQPKILTKLIKSVVCDKYYPNDSDDDDLELSEINKIKNDIDEMKIGIMSIEKSIKNIYDSDDENEFADNAFSNDSENEYADKELNKKEWEMSYTNIIFFIFGYLQLNNIDFGDKQQNFIQYCYYKMRECDDKCKDCNKTLKQFPINYDGIVDKDDYNAFWCLYKQIDGAWDTFCLHIHHNNIEIPPNFNYSQVFYDERFGIINPK